MNRAHEASEDAMLDLAVVVLSFHGTMLRNVVEAVAASRGLRIGIVVVDNDDRDSARALDGMPLPPTVPLVVLPEVPNRGFAAGNNLGLYALPARYICLLNNDALVEEGTLARLVAFMDQQPRAGACAPRLNRPDGSAQPFSHGADPSPAYLLRRSLARRRGRALHDWGGIVPRRVEWVAFTCVILRPRALEVAGVLDEEIFMYFEDNDLCLRLRRRGWRVYFVPDVAVRHFNSPSYADYRRRADYAAGLARIYRRRYGRLAGHLMSLAGRVRLLPARLAPRSKA